MTQTAPSPSPRCPECDHAAPARGRLGLRLERLLRITPECPETAAEYDANGGPTACGCRHPAHAT